VIKPFYSDLTFQITTRFNQKEPMTESMLSSNDLLSHLSYYLLLV